MTNGELKSQIEACKKGHHQVNLLLDEKKKERDELLKKVTPEQRKKYERFERRSAHYIKNNDIVGLRILQKNFKL